MFIDKITSTFTDLGPCLLFTHFNDKYKLREKAKPFIYQQFLHKLKRFQIKLIMFFISSFFSIKTLYIQKKIKELF